MDRKTLTQTDLAYYYESMLARRRMQISFDRLVAVAAEIRKMHSHVARMDQALASRGQR